MDHRQLVREDGRARRLGQVVVEQPEDRDREHQGHGIVAVPPLHDGVLHPGEDRIAAPESGRDGQRIDEVQQGDADPANPLRAEGRLGAAAGIEYAAQAMALHGSLLAGEGSAPRQG